jgi:ferrochelatase
MTYGSPSSLERDDVRTYLARVRGGREPETELVEEFTRRYRAIGGSPLLEITRRQATALSAQLGWPVEVGMRFSEPSIELGLRELMRSGVTDVAAIILSPQYSPLLMAGYGRALAVACDAIANGSPNVAVAGAWHREPAFIRSIGERVGRALAEAPAGQRSATHVLMTAHSLPRRVADEEPDYLAQLHETAEAVAAEAGLASHEWTFCWQSAGHEPGEWMSPDFADLMPTLAAAGHDRVLVAPIQFLADHLEVLYDVDIGAREQAEGAGLRFARIRSLDDHPGLIEALAAVVARTASVPA